MASLIHPTTQLDMYDGGPPVDRKESSGSSMSGGSARRHDKDHYNKDDFDDMISAAVIEPTRRGRQLQEGHNDQDDNGPIMVDSTPDDAPSEDDDMNSLNSDDISGGSDISDVEQAREANGKAGNKNFTPRPLINDDESTVDMRPPAPVNQSVSSYVEALNQQQTRKNRVIKCGMVFILLSVIIGVVLAIVSVTGKNTSNDVSGVEDDMNGSGGNGGNSALEISVKEGFTGSNTTTYSPSLSPIYLDLVTATSSPVTNAGLTPAITPTSSPSLPPQTALPTKNPTLPPQSALPTSRPTPVPVETIVETDAPAASPVAVTPEPTPEPTFLPTDDPTYEPTPMPSPDPTPQPTILITAQPITPNPTPLPTSWPTRKPFTITSPPTPRPTLRPIAAVPPSPSGPTLHAGGGSPADGTFHCAEVRYTSNWNELVDLDCELPCSGLGMNSECPDGRQCRSDEGNCL